MAKLGLDDDITVARIKDGTCDFQLSDTDLLDLKKSGVSSRVVAAMLDMVPVTAAPAAAAAAPEPSGGNVGVFVTDKDACQAMLKSLK